VTLIDPATPVIVQGATGRVGKRHTLAMKAYGTNIVGGVSPRADAEIEGIPLFRSCAEAVRTTGAQASVLFVPPLQTLTAMREALDAGVKTLVTLAEGIPVHDALKARRLTTDAGVTWIGGSTPGLAIPGKIKLGFLPSVSLAPGKLGVMAKSGTLSYEVCHRLVSRGLGQSLWVGVGGDSVKGMRFADLLPVFNADPNTDAVVVIGEIGGSEEEELAAAMRGAAHKPVYALIAGASAREGVTMGHAGAMIDGNTGTVESKARALGDAGAQVFHRIQDLIDVVAVEQRA
jgi:succinyl-CoA synthetase alpha subunit